MSTKTQKIVLGAVAALAVVVMAWVVWAQASGQEAGGGKEGSHVPVLCANARCGHVGEASLPKLVPPGGGSPARAPAWGPGYKCPKCGQETLYTEPKKCEKCGTLYLSTVDANGSIVSQCPKCNK
jgi:hypothetical protein